MSRSYEMTGMLFALAFSSCVVSALPSIDATIRSFAPWVIWLSIWFAWVGTSFSAYCRSTL